MAFCEIVRKGTGMESAYLRHLLEQVRGRRIDLDSAMQQLKNLPFDDLGFAKVDNHRCVRTGVPEVIYSEGKTLAHIQGIVKNMARRHDNILATRASREVFEGIRMVTDSCEYHDLARIVVINPRPVKKIGNIAVVCAGTCDIPVAEEAVVTAQVLGNRVSRFYDVGVAGIHRLLHVRDELYQANVAVVAAGMEGALASVVGGLVPYPVVAVPTSIGYGASFGGIAALLSMLNSCASGVSVVNIDNGFGAGYQTSLINRLAVNAASGEGAEGPAEKAPKVAVAGGF